MSYAPYVAKIDSLGKHPKADRLQLAQIRGQTVVVGLEIKEGDLGLFFPEGGQLGEEFAQANDLVRRTDPATGLRAGGLFEENRRIKAVALRGVKSEGFWIPVDSLIKLTDATYRASVVKLKDGQELKEFAGFVLGKKYYTPKQREQIAAGTFKQRREVHELAKHADTKPFALAKDSIPAGSWYSLTEKLHGTSGRTYKGRVKAEERLWDRVKAFFGRPTIRVVTGSRNVVFEKVRTTNVFHGLGAKGSSAVGKADKSDNFRIAISEKLAPYMKPGESVFYEIVGTGLVAPANYGRLATQYKVKELKSKYGAVVEYDYGVPAGEYDFYVYNIQQDGVNLDRQSFLQRCAALGARWAPTLWVGFIPEDGRLKLEEYVAKHSVGPTRLGANFEREGCIIRIDAPDGSVRFLKEKCWSFKALEGQLRDDNDYCDLEEGS